METLVFLGQVWRPDMMLTQGRSCEWRWTEAKSASIFSLIWLAWWYWMWGTLSYWANTPTDRSSGSDKDVAIFQMIWWRPCHGPRPCQGRPDVQRHCSSLLSLPQGPSWSVVKTRNLKRKDSLARASPRPGNVIAKTKETRGLTRRSRSSSLPLQNVFIYLTLYARF